MRLPVAGLLFAAALAAAPKTLDVYFIDVEGGQATLIISPSGESMLVDSGWAGLGGRDADRIAETAKKAGLRKIDYFLATHYHADHVGGVAEVAQRIPIGAFVDHGPSVEAGKNPDALFAAYAQARTKGRHLEVKAGDKVPLKGLDVQVLSSGGGVIGSALKGAGAANPLCGAAGQKAEDKSENARSVGTLITFGKFRLLDLGDLTWNKELELVCPNNRIGAVDVYLTTHHGADSSGPAALVHAVKPRVAIMNNGSRKGGSPAAWQAIKTSPGLEDIWQVHFAIAAGKENNTGEALIANLEDTDAGTKCKGLGLKLSATSDGRFTVSNERNGQSKAYAARR